MDLILADLYYYFQSFHAKVQRPKKHKEIKYITEKTMVKKQKALNVASVFSGIGAFEQALKQLKIKHNIIFACDNGERDLTFSYDVISQLSRNLTEEQKYQFAKCLWISNRLKHIVPFEKFLLSLYGEEKAREKLELSYDSIMLLTQGMSSFERKTFVEDLYAKTKKCNWVKKSYTANYPIKEEQWYEDIRFLEGRQYAGMVDILVGGSPCQSFSTYGKKLGLEDTRGTLFYDYARVISEVQPKVFIYENVKNVTMHDHGHTWKTMKQVWNSLNYDLHWTILNAQDYGTPQLRRRLFLVGFRRDVIVGKAFEFPKPFPLTCTSHDFMESVVASKYYLGKKGFEWVTTPQKNQRRTRVNQDITGCQTATQQDNWTGDLRVEPAQQWHRDDERIYVGLYNGIESVARKMTPKECLRLMGFMDFEQVVPDKVMYRQSGNSIVVTVLEALISEILKTLNTK